ncbi:hypothetical protein [Halobellus clavatus]|nr:hypothetical protein [Halobellus clavatus]
MRSSLRTAVDARLQEPSPDTFPAAAHYPPATAGQRTATASRTRALRR